MKLYKNLDIYSKNTMRLHCIASHVYEPESIEELKKNILLFHKSGTNYYILGAGSNVILPPKLDTPIVLTSSVDNSIVFEGNKVICGCSVRIQNLIRVCQRKGLGGLEYLFSVPCNVGGAVYMNAGGGRNHGNSISDYIENVEIFNPCSGNVEKIDRGGCDFSYRHSIFQNNTWIILRVYFVFPHATKDEVENRIKLRMKYAKEKQAGNLPSCGSIFNKCNPYIMRLLRGLQVGGACWSKKTTNWISNNGDAKANDIYRLIGIAKFLHRISFQKYHIEVKIWK